MTQGNRKAKKLARQRKTKTGEAYTTSLMKNQIMESQIQAHANLEIEFKTVRPEIVELGTGRGASPIDTQVQEQLAIFGLIDERGRLKTEAIADSGLSEEYVRDIIENGVILPYLDQDGKVDMHRSMLIKPEKTKSEEGSDWRSEMVESLIAKYPIPEPHESLEISPRSGKSMLFESQLRIAAAHGPVTVIDPKGNVDPQTLMFGRFLEDADPNEWSSPYFLQPHANGDRARLKRKK